MENIRLPFTARLAAVLFCILAIGYLAHLGHGILAPLFFAFLLAAMFVPFANILEHRLGLSRTLSTVSSVLIMITALTGIIYFFSAQLSDFANDFPMLERQIVRTFHEIQNWVSRTFHLNLDKQMVYLNQGLEKLLSSTGVILTVTLSMFSSVLAFVAFSILFFIFILNYRRQLYEFLLSLFSEKHIFKVHSAVSDAQKIIKQYVLGLLIQILIVSVLTSGLLTLLGVKYAVLLGVLTGFLNVIPYIGIFFSCLIACLISFATGGQHTLFVLIGYVGIHALDANITLPLVVGSKVKINAFFSFLALLVGEELWGISGMFLSIPLLAIIKIIFERVEPLKPWARVMGEESHEEERAQKTSLIQRLRWRKAHPKNPE